MATLEQFADIIEKTLCACAKRYATEENLRTLMAFDRTHGQFLLLDEGWAGYKRIHQIWAHIELRGEKVWMHEDGTEVGIANLLVEAGVPNQSIVLAFHAPAMRSATDFAVA